MFLISVVSKEYTKGYICEVQLRNSVHYQQILRITYSTYLGSNLSGVKLNKMSHIARRRLGSVGDSAPPSDSSEGTASETCESNPDWSSVDGQPQQNNSLFINSDADDSISLETSSLLSMNERAQVESFFSGLGTEVFVCSSLANLYEGAGKDDWRLIYTGIPVLLHDKGLSRSRTIPRVTFCLAERGSCFSLWRDTIDNLSDYKVAGPAFHTMHLSSDHRQVIGFSFDASESARELWKVIERLISDPENIAINIPNARKKNKQKRVKPPALPPKSQISHPCQFQHVTSVTTEDASRYYSLQAFVAPQSAVAKHRLH